MANDGVRHVIACPYNKEGVDCDQWLIDIKHGEENKHCEKCGWNPIVWAERVLKLKGVVEEDAGV